MGNVECPKCGKDFSASGFYKHWRQVHSGRAPVLHIEHIHRDKELLEYLYHKKGYSQRKIAKMLGKNRDTIQRWMKRLEIPVSNANDPETVLRTRHKKNEDSGCWEYTGYIHDTGYGEVSIQQESRRTHRLAYETWVGEIPPDAWVLHKCHNKKCINPDHLYVGDVRDNVQDAMDEGSFWHDGMLKSGEENRHSKLTEKDVSEIRRLYEETEISQRELSERFDCSIGNINRVLNGITWQHV